MDPYVKKLWKGDGDIEVKASDVRIGDVMSLSRFVVTGIERSDDGKLVFLSNERRSRPMSRDADVWIARAALERKCKESAKSGADGGSRRISEDDDETTTTTRRDAQCDENRRLRIRSEVERR